ncbi:MAG: 2-hydroxyacyl-CoA dehydratase family protein [Spirochaetes bacterium]|nr:2-hydroxyacyl-CoA dehydratase family protein [Spirochaetota bacterium]
MTAIVTNLQEVLSQPQNKLIERALANKMLPVGYACSMVPIPLLSIKPLFPVRLRAAGITSTELGDLYLSSVICSLSRSLLEYALSGEYDFLRGFVFVASCDHLRRLYDNLAYCQNVSFNHILDIPHRYSEASVEWTIDEFQRFAKKLSSHFGIGIDNECIMQAIHKKEELHAILRRISEMRKLPHPPFTGTDYHRLIVATQIVPIDDAIQLAKEFYEMVTQRGKVPPQRARVMIVGGNLDDPTFTEIIESQGALVVADRYCTGSFPELEPYETEGNAFEIMAKRVLALNRCPRMMEGYSTRLEYILHLYREYAVDGIIIESIKFCDTWGVETSAMVTQLREMGIPVLRLEREYRLSGEGQLRTRVQAFIESMGK